MKEILKNKNNTYLLGSSAKLDLFLEPFNPMIINFLNEFSIILNQSSLPDLRALAFFCRKKNILNLKKKYLNLDEIRFGLGLIFHITPSNVPTNFAYSLIFGLLSGNSNIVKVPSKKFNEINEICKHLKTLLSKKKYVKVKNMISIVRYPNNESITKSFSKISDARLIWGGDKTISDLKKFETKPKNLDIPFSDRYSITIINADKFSKLSKHKISNLIKNFYNDTYSVDQNACSSPHLILWKGKLSVNAKKIFWNNLNSLVNKKYFPPLISSMDNYSQLVSDLIGNKNFYKFKTYSKSLYVITLKKLYPDLFIKKTKWGFFYECNINNLQHINYVTQKGLQTVTYYGFTKNFLKSFFKKNNFNGIDRVVPIGQALNINLIWDGFDIVNTLSRQIEIQ